MKIVPADAVSSNTTSTAVHATASIWTRGERRDPNPKPFQGIPLTHSGKRFSANPRMVPQLSTDLIGEERRLPECSEERRVRQEELPPDLAGDHNSVSTPCRRLVNFA